MANKRNLKKNINYICGELFSECAAMALYGDKHGDDIKALLTSIIIIRNDYISRISHVEPGLSPRAYFKDIKAKFNAQVGELIDNISNI